jgi:hypothetical protein
MHAACRENAWLGTPVLLEKKRMKNRQRLLIAPAKIVSTASQSKG